MLPFLLAFVMSACGAPSEPGQPDTLPTPSGPPLAQQSAPQPVQPAAADPIQWETVVQGPATTLRLVESGATRLQMTCIGRPARLIVNAPGFAAIGSEDRFSLGLGDRPVTLVADLRARSGVTAEMPMPDNLPALLREAKAISAYYGQQRVGPFAPPPPELARAFADACESV